MDERSLSREMSPRVRVLMALAFFFFSGFLFAFVFGWLQPRPSASPTPMWVIAGAAMMFFLAGVLILLVGSERWTWLRNLVMWLFVLSLAIPFNWVAFGEGERHFSGSTSFLGFASSSSPGETEGRIVFGLFAVLMDLMVVLLPLRLLKNGRSE